MKIRARRRGKTIAACERGQPIEIIRADAGDADLECAATLRSEFLEQAS